MAKTDLMTDEDRIALIDDLNERGIVDGHDDYQSMIRRALQCTDYIAGDELRAEYGVE